MQIDEFINSYKQYCKVKFGTKTGTAPSYANALRYLFEYLNCSDVNENVILTIKSIEPDIRDKHCAFYNNIHNAFAMKGRSSYIENGFVKAAIPILYDFLSDNPLQMTEPENDILISEIKDNSIVAQFNIKNLRGILPIAAPSVHTYNICRINGNVNSAVKKIYSGRKAEKYFVSFLENHLGLTRGTDFVDVSNNKEYGYDIRLFECGIEIKNIKNGGFYLTDNEIARLEQSETHLVFVDVDNGIWLLKNHSDWLKTVIANIKSIRRFCSENYRLLDLTDICIRLDESTEKEIVDITKLNIEQLKNLL